MNVSRQVKTARSRGSETALTSSTAMLLFQYTLGSAAINAIPPTPDAPLATVAHPSVFACSAIFALPVHPALVI